MLWGRGWWEKRTDNGDGNVGKERRMVVRTDHYPHHVLSEPSGFPPNFCTQRNSLMRVLYSQNISPIRSLSYRLRIGGVFFFLALGSSSPFSTQYLSHSRFHHLRSNTLIFQCIFWSTHAAYDSLVRYTLTLIFITDNPLSLQAQT